MWCVSLLLSWCVVVTMVKVNDTSEPDKHTKHGKVKTPSVDMGGASCFHTGVGIDVNGKQF